MPIEDIHYDDRLRSRLIVAIKNAIGGELSKILNSFANVVDAVNTLRNRGSVAHPNETLLDAVDAELIINAIRTLFHYLTQKLSR